MTSLADSIRVALADGENWRSFAACAGVDPDLFFPHNGEATHTVRHAQAICHGCPVRLECGRTAIELGEYWGIWGGMTQTQLRQARRRAGHSDQSRPTARKAAA